MKLFFSLPKRHRVTAMAKVVSSQTHGVCLYRGPFLFFSSTRRRQAIQRQPPQHLFFFFFFPQFIRPSSLKPVSLILFSFQPEKKERRKEKKETCSETSTTSIPVLLYPCQKENKYLLFSTNYTMWPIARPVRRSLCAGEIKRKRKRHPLSYNVWNTFDHIKIRPRVGRGDYTHSGYPIFTRCAPLLSPDKPSLVIFSQQKKDKKKKDTSATRIKDNWFLLSYPHTHLSIISRWNWKKRERNNIIAQWAQRAGRKMVAKSSGL